MSYDKVVDSSVLDAGLKQIADAIRAKAGTSGNMAFPTAMAEAIAAIEAGGGGGGNIAYGTVTAATTNAAITVTHDLGVIPTIGVFIRVDDSGTSSTDEIFTLYQATGTYMRLYTWKSTIYAMQLNSDQPFTDKAQSYYFNNATTTTVCTPKLLIAGHAYFWALFA
jgi:hypothetical protein